MATAAASDAKPITAKAITALPTSNDRRLSREGMASVWSTSSYSSNSGPYSSPANGSASSAIEYASCGSSTSGGGTTVVSSPLSPAAGAIAVSSPVSPTAGAIAVASPAGTAVCAAAAMAAPRASAKDGSSATCTRMVDASWNWSAS